MTNTTRYTFVAIALHWVIALLVIFMVFFGEGLIEGGEETGQTFLPSLHVSLGITILVLSVVRLLWRLTHAAPPFPATMKAWEVGLARVTHVVFYVLTIGVPVVGWLALPGLIAEEPAMSGISAFGFALPQAPMIDAEAGELHEVGSKIAMVLILLHVAAALKHQFVDRDGIFKRMSPH